MAIRVEDLRLPRSRDIELTRLNTTQVAELLRRKINPWKSRKPSGRKYTCDDLFRISSDYDGLIPKNPGMLGLEKRSELYVMEKSKLQHVGLRVMREFGLDTDTFKEEKREFQLDVIQFRDYPSKKYKGLTFQRYLTIDRRTGKPTEVGWRVTRTSTSPSH